MANTEKLPLPLPTLCFQASGSRNLACCFLHRPEGIDLRHQQFFNFPRHVQLLLNLTVSRRIFGACVYKLHIHRMETKP